MGPTLGNPHFARKLGLPTAPRPASGPEPLAPETRGSLARRVADQPFRAAIGAEVEDLPVAERLQLPTRRPATAPAETMEQHGLSFIRNAARRVLVQSCQRQVDGFPQVPRVELAGLADVHQPGALPPELARPGERHQRQAFPGHEHKETAGNADGQLPVHAPGPPPFRPVAKKIP